MLKDYQEHQQSECAPLAGQINEVKNLIEMAKRRVKRLASLMGSARPTSRYYRKRPLRICGAVLPRSIRTWK